MQIHENNDFEIHLVIRIKKEFLNTVFHRVLLVARLFVQACELFDWNMALVAKLTRKHRFHRNRSVFLDLGSGVGIPSIYVALRFGVRTIGVERCPDLVDLANQFAASAGVAHLCRFVCADVCRLGPQWFCDERISHIFAFDARFGDETLQKMYRVLGRVKSPMVGCNPVSTRPFWPGVFAQVGGSSRSAKMTGRGATSFRFVVWDNCVPHCN